MKPMQITLDYQDYLDLVEQVKNGVEKLPHKIIFEHPMYGGGGIKFNGQYYSHYNEHIDTVTGIKAQVFVKI